MDVGERPVIAALTCTGGRPRALALCEKYIRRQTRTPDVWVMVDDCEVQTADGFMGPVIRPEPFWKSCGPHTLPRNMVAGMEYIRDELPSVDIVTIFEDDDWYDPAYLETMVNALDERLDSGVKVVGEMNTYYYNVLSRSWKRNFNPTHASLCSVSFHVSAFPDIIRLTMEARTPYVDLRIFRKMPPETLHLEKSALCIGIKGTPDLRLGSGGSHRGWHPGYVPDPDMTKLRELVGDDADFYAEYFNMQSFEKMKAQRETPRRQRRRMLQGKALEIANARRRRR